MPRYQSFTSLTQVLLTLYTKVETPYHVNTDIFKFLVIFTSHLRTQATDIENNNPVCGKIHVIYWTVLINILIVIIIEEAIT